MTHRSRRLLISLGALVVVWGAGVCASAQPVIVQTHPREWTLQATINVRSYQDARRTDRSPTIDVWKFDTAAIVFPLLQESGSHQMIDRQLVSTLSFNDRVVDESPTMLTGYQSGTRLGRWDLVDKEGRELELKLSIPTRCWETQLNEEAAARISWPSGDWPPIPASTFQPQMYVDFGPEGPYDMRPIENAVKRWTDGKPKSVPPATLAKWLTGQVVQSFQVSGTGLAFDRTGMIQGIDLQGAPRAARRGRGSRFDMACLLVAVFKEAGLPARLVIGLDTGFEDEKDEFLGGNDSKDELRAWVEFALYDETSSRTYWIPVDPVRIREKSSRLSNDFMDKPLAYFGTHDELDGVIPFAFQFHPPTTVRAYGSPGFWGWLVTPEPPKRAYQMLRFEAVSTPVRGGRPTDTGRGRGRR